MRGALAGALVQLAVLGPLAWLGGPTPHGLALLGLLTAWCLAEARVAVPGPREPGWHAPAMGLALLSCLALSLATGVGGAGWAAVLVATGAVLRVWSARELGPWFNDQPVWLPGQPRVQTGPYRWLNHPSELGNALIAAGAALLVGSAWGLVVASGMVAPVAWLRARAEDAQRARAGVLRRAESGADLPPRHLGRAESLTAASVAR